MARRAPATAAEVASRETRRRPRGTDVFTANSLHAWFTPLADFGTQRYSTKGGHPFARCFIGHTAIQGQGHGRRLPAAVGPLGQ